MSGNYICWDHELDFPTEQALQNHLASECAKFLAKGAVCLFMDTEGQCCGKTFNHISSLMYHYFCKHRKYACAYCYQLFDHREDLDAHKHTAGRHLREEPYKCHSCTSSFNSKKAQKQHVTFAHRRLPTPRSAQEPKFKCEVCEERYTSKAIMKRHMRKKHKKVEKESMPGEMTTATHHPVDLTAGDGEDIEAMACIVEEMDEDEYAAHFGIECHGKAN